jgi:hypothetical protein
VNDAPFDGNAAGGDLADLVAFDITTAVVTCAACQARHPVATLRAYLRAPGIVLRCGTCDAVQIRVVTTPDRTWLDVSGVTVVEIATPLGRPEPRTAQHAGS